jgi:hypothetical protein
MRSLGKEFCNIPITKLSDENLKKKQKKALGLESRRLPNQVNPNPKMKMISQSRRSLRRTKVRGCVYDWMVVFNRILFWFMDLCYFDIVICA